MESGQAGLQRMGGAAWRGLLKAYPPLVRLAMAAAAAECVAPAQPRRIPALMEHLALFSLNGD